MLERPPNGSEACRPHTDTPDSEQRSSMFADLMGRQPIPRAVTVTDLFALIIGFAGAGYIYRGTVLADQNLAAPGRLLVAIVAFVWLGTVLSGPLVLFLRTIQHARRTRLSAGEAIWTVLGVLWISVGVARTLRGIDPIEMTNLISRAASVAAGLAPILLIGLWYVERIRSRPGGPYSWCHHVGILCAAAWPAGWPLAAFLLGS